MNTGNQDIKPIAIIATFVLICVALGIFLADCQRTEETESSTQDYTFVEDIFSEVETSTEDDATVAADVVSEESTTVVAESPLVDLTAETTAETTRYEEPAEDDEEPDQYDDDYDSDYGSYIGNFKLTAYEWTGERMANGEYPYYGACACNCLPMGTVVYIEGHGTFKVCDRGGMTGNWIDIYLGDEATCNQFGVQYADVYYG